MRWRTYFAEPERRSRLLGIVLTFGTILTLPAPHSDSAVFKVALWALLLFLCALGWSHWYRQDLRSVLWFGSFCLSLFLLYKGSTPFPALLLFLSELWHRVRLKNLTKLKTLLVIFPMVCSAAKKPEAKAGDIDIPKYLTGYKLNDFISCGQVDKIPWKFRPEGRKVRLLLKDVLRLNSETKFANWEIFQVMDNKGYVSYIFRRALKNGSYESIVAKENLYNKILETSRGKRIVEVQNLKNFINRTVFTFVSSDDGTISYLPGLAGRSLLTLQLSQAEGRMLPPLFLKGSMCDRPDDADKIGTQASGGATDAPPAATVPDPAGSK